MAGRHAAPLQERTTGSTETSGHEVVPAALPDTAHTRLGPEAVPEAFTSRRARRDAERAVPSASAAAASVVAPSGPETAPAALVATPVASVSTPAASVAAPAPSVLHFAAGSVTAERAAADAATPRRERTAADLATRRRASSASRAATRRARVAPTARRATGESSREQHHPVSLRRAALLLAPVLAVTSGIALASPANADPLPQHFTDVAQRTGQVFTVASDVRLPVMQDDGTTVVSLPSLVVSGGASVGQAQTTLRSALAAGGPRAKVLETALTYLGDTYVEGGASHQGIDCSGLTMVAYQSVGISLVHYVPTQDAAATTIPASEALPGDLVVYDDEDHVGLYLGDDLVLQAPHPGEPVDIIPMFSAAHHFARVLPA